jgi:small subunit ribosomal protein S6
MPFYETVFIARQELTTAQVDELTQTYSKVLKDAGGKITKTENWGLRTLAYKINKARKGHYVLIESDVDGAAIIEMERLMRIDENIMRYMSIRLEELSKGPSAILNKHDRDSDNFEKEVA